MKSGAIVGIGVAILAVIAVVLGYVAGRSQQGVNSTTTQVLSATSSVQASSARQDEIDRAQLQYESCLSQAQQSYKSSIKNACGGASGCIMPATQAQVEDNALASDKVLCEQHYQATLQAIQ